MNLKLTYRLSLILISSILLCSCTKEDLTKCSLQLRLKYDYSMEDELIDLIDFVDLYVFDKQDKFVELLRVDARDIIDGHKINVPYHYKDKVLVVWAREMKENYITPELKVGDDIELLTLKLITDNNISSKRLAHLFHGGKEIMNFENETQTHTINFTRTNNAINLSLKDANNQPIEISGKYDIKLTACNAHYSNDHNIIPNSPEITYTPTNEAVIKAQSKTQNIANLHTLRLQPIYSDDVKLTVYNREQEQYVTFGNEQELKLIEYLLKTKPSGVSDQEYLDNKSNWDISFLVSEDESEDKDIALSITINGWTIWFHNTDL